MSHPLIQPFRALRPSPGHAADVVAPPYDVVNTEEARALVEGKPWSFLHISKPEIDLPAGTSPFDDSVYAKGTENINRMVEAGVLVRDAAPAYYVYRVQMEEHVQTGIVGAGSVQAYEKNLIRRHELTRPDKETDRVKQILAVNAQTGPVFTTHKPDQDLSAVTEEITSGAPDYSVTGEGGVLHTLWVVSGVAQMDRITAGFDRLGVIYIADGHHRSAAASRVAADRQAGNPDHTGDEPYNSFLIVSFPEPEVQVLDYNRVIKDLNGLSVEDLILSLGGSFSVEKSADPVKPDAVRTFGMYVQGQWYSLIYTGAAPDPANPTADLDVSVLTAAVLSPVLGIGDPRTDPRIDFVGGIRGMAELEKRVDGGDWAVAFSLYPTSVDQLIAVADADEIMPPKTTWFEPKLADGMVSLMLD
ncbi:MAG: DUF1015 family protein [Rhodospirillales bacterium]|nr:DUF1015 family protein [Rhodospirillales bacterium]